MGVHDADCDCELPLDLEDSDLEIYHRGDAIDLPSVPARTSAMTGFITFAKLCKISSKIVKSVNPLQMKRLRDKYNVKRAHNEMRNVVKELDAELADWLLHVPDCIKFSSNNTDVKSPHLTMCVIAYIVHAGSVVNLYWCVHKAENFTSRLLTFSLGQSCPRRLACLIYPPMLRIFIAQMLLEAAFKSLS